VATPDDRQRGLRTAAIEARLLPCGESEHLAERRGQHENDDEGHANGDTHESDEFRCRSHPNLPQHRPAAAAYRKRDRTNHGKDYKKNFLTHGTSTPTFAALSQAGA
jgi:hypothetical protein